MHGICMNFDGEEIVDGQGSCMLWEDAPFRCIGWLSNDSCCIDYEPWEVIGLEKSQNRFIGHLKLGSAIALLIMRFVFLQRPESPVMVLNGHLQHFFFLSVMVVLELDAITAFERGSFLGLVLEPEDFLFLRQPPQPILYPFFPIGNVLNPILI